MLWRAAGRLLRSKQLVVVLVSVLLGSGVFAATVVYHHPPVAHTTPATRSSATTQDPSQTTALPEATGESSAAATPTQTSSSSVGTTSSPPTVIVKPIVPDNLTIPAIQLNAPVLSGASSVQYDPHTGQQELLYPVPDNLTSVTWWKEGPVSTAPNAAIALAPKPGSLGVAILTMHASLQGKGQGVGDYLGTLGRGQQIRVHGTDDQGHRTQDIFTVLGKQTELDKKKPEAFAKAIRNAPKGTRLILITCSGSVDWSISSSNFNTVVYAGLSSAGS